MILNAFSFKCTYMYDFLNIQKEHQDFKEPSAQKSGYYSTFNLPLVLMSQNFCLSLRFLLVLSVMEHFFIIFFAVIFDTFEDSCSLQLALIHTNQTQ